MSEIECVVCSEIVPLKRSTCVSGIGLVCDICIYCEYIILKRPKEHMDNVITFEGATRVIGLRKALKFMKPGYRIGIFKDLEYD